MSKVSPSARVDIAGVELGYEGPSGFHENTTAFFSARSFDFGRVFEFIDEEDIGQPELTDIVLKTVTELDDRNTIEFLGIYAPEDYTRDIDNVLASPDFEDVSLIEAEQDLALLGVSWRRLVGAAGEWTNRLYFRENDKTSSEGEAFPDLVPEGTPAADIPVRERLLTVGEAETEIGWRSDYSMQNRFGEIQAGLRAWQTDVDYFVFLREDWDRFVYRSTDPAFTPSAATLVDDFVLATTFTDSVGLAPATTYHYIVRAVDEALASAAPVTARTRRSSSPSRVPGGPRTSPWSRLAATDAASCIRTRISTC